MSDEEYRRFLSILAEKHILSRERHIDPSNVEQLREWLTQATNAARLHNATRDRPDAAPLLRILEEDIHKYRPVSRAAMAMERTGLLNAIDDGGEAVFAELRRSAIPDEDVRMLRNAGYSDGEIEMILDSPLYYSLAGESHHRVHLLNELDEILAKHVRHLRELYEMKPHPETAPKKRKLFNGIGKILGGSIGGIGNALMAAGTILAPNPATAAGAIASAAVSIPAIFSGIGDLRGE